jgi:hypothetical protein
LILKRKIIKKIGTITIWSLGAILFDLLLVLLLLLIPAVQTFVAKQVADYFSSELHAKVTIETISISPSLNVNLNKVFISDQHYNPMIASEKIVVTVADFSPIKKKLAVNRLHLVSPEFYLKKYAMDSTMNLTFLISYFSTGDTVKTSNKWLINAKNIELENARFSYDNFHKLPLQSKQQLDFNHLNIANVSGVFSKFAMVKDSIKVRVDNFSMIDSSGFWIKKMGCNFLYCKGEIRADNLNLTTGKSKILANASLKYKDISDFKEFADKIHLNLRLFDSRINTEELSFFIRKNPLGSNLIRLKGSFNGFLNNLTVENLNVGFGTKSNIVANGKMMNVLDFSNLHIQSQVKSLTVTIDDIEKIKLQNNRKIRIPQQFVNIYKINAKGDFKGSLTNFKANLALNSPAGNVTAVVDYMTKNKQIFYQLAIKSDGFDVAMIAPSSGLKKIALNTSINGSGLSAKDVAVKISGDIDYIEYKNYVFENSKIDGNYSKKVFFGHVLIDDPMLKLDFNGTIDYSKAVPEYQFIADVEHARLAQLQLVKRDLDCSLTTHLNASIKGSKFDDFIGKVVLFDTKYYEEGRNYSIDNIDLASEIDQLGYRSINLKSDWIDLYTNGRFEFSDLNSSFKYILKKYLPSYAPEKLNISNLITITNNSNPNNKKTNKNERRFLSFDIDVKDSDPITTLFVPKLKAKGKTSCSGFLNTITQHVDFVISTDTLKVGAIEFNELKLSGSSKDSVLNVLFDCKDFVWSKRDTFLFSNIHLTSQLKKDSLVYSIGWNSNNHFDQLSTLDGELIFSKSPILRGKISSANIYVNDSIWHVMPENMFVIDKNQYTIQNLTCYSHEKKIAVDGRISHDPNDVLTVKLTSFNLSEADPWANNRMFDLDGIVTGKVELSQLMDKFSIIINLKVKDLGLNGQHLGSANVVSAWDDRKKGLFVNIEALYRGNVGENKPVVVLGYFYPKDQTLDMDAEIDKLKLKIIEPYLKTIFYRVDGIASGKLKIIGTINRIQVAGKIKLMRTMIGVNFLNTEYTINQEVEIQKNKIVFDSLTAYDTRNQIAVVNGWITHDEWRNFKMDISIKALNLMSMNTTRAMNEMFYGKAFGTGMVRIYGAAPNIQIDAQAETNEGTDISVPINFNTVVDKSAYINFVSNKQTDTLSATNKFIDLGLSMNFLFNVTPDATFHVFLDPSTGGSLHGKGKGSIRMNVNTKGDFSMFGTFVVANGKYQLKLKDVFTRDFEIEEGGTVQWNGDPRDADIEIRAKRTINNVSIASALNLDTSNSNSYNRKMKVVSVVKLTGKLMNPTVKFGIELPGADNTTQNMFYNMIDTTNDQNMIRQTFSLLVLGKLEPTTNPYGAIVSEGLGMTSMELFSNQLSNYLSQVTGNLNVSFNYKTADQITTDELQIAISKTLFNDRVTIEGSMSAGGQNKYIQNTNNVVGDVILEVKLTPDGRWRSKVYNIANTNEYTYQNAPYVQGVGFVYRVDFNKFSELFRKKK